MAFPYDGVQFKKGGVANPKGRPRKSFRVVNTYLKEAGVTPISRTDLIQSYKLIFNATEQQLKDIASDPEVPYALKLIILELNTKKTRLRALQDLRDYVFGRAAENKNLNVVVEQPLFSFQDAPILEIDGIIDITPIDE